MLGISVYGITGDSFVRDRRVERVDLIEIDTESTEPEVLRGMIETIGRDHPIILCEVLKGCGSEEPPEEILSYFGYRFYLLTSDGPVLRDRVEGHPNWLNYLFTTLGPDYVAGL